MFFENFDPPAADPHRARHLQDAYILVYGLLGVLLCLLSNVGMPFRRGAPTLVFSGLAFFVLRYRGIPRFFDPHSEEAYFGGPAFFLCAAAVLSLTVLARRQRCIACGIRSQRKDSRFMSIPSKAALGATAGGLLLWIALVLGIWVLVSTEFGPYDGIGVDIRHFNSSAVRAAMLAVQSGALVGLALVCVLFPTFRRRRGWLVGLAFLLHFLFLAVPVY